MGGGEGRQDSRGSGLSGVASRICRSEVNVGFVVDKSVCEGNSST